MNFDMFINNVNVSHSRVVFASFRDIEAKQYSKFNCQTVMIIWTKCRCKEYTVEE